MPYDPVSVANAALRLCGIGQKISSLSDTSHRAEVLNDTYDNARDLVLARFEWPFTTRRIDLGLVEEDPNGDWLYSYRYPIDCVMVRRIARGTGLPETAPIPFTLGQDATGRLIFCDEESAVIEYSATAEDPGEWPDALADAISAEWARKAYPAFKVGADRSSMIESAAANALVRAQGLQAQEQQRHPAPVSSYISVRNARRDPRYRYDRGY